MARYRSLPVTVDARPLQDEARIGLAQGVPGDYLVTFQDGGLTIMSKEVFEASYRGPLAPAGRKKKAVLAKAA